MQISLAEFGQRLLAASGAAKLIEHEVLKLQCEAVEAEAKSYFGHYNHPGAWAQLAETTQKRRVHLGFNANEPLLRTGDLRDSIQHAVDDGVGYVFSNSPIARYQELGAPNLPPRPFLSTAAMSITGRLEEIAARSVTSLLASAIIHGPGRFWAGVQHLDVLPSGEGVTEVMHR